MRMHHYCQRRGGSALARYRRLSNERFFAKKGKQCTIPACFTLLRLPGTLRAHEEDEIVTQAVGQREGNIIVSSGTRLPLGMQQDELAALGRLFTRGWLDKVLAR